jgi:hypothetical protein
MDELVKLVSDKVNISPDQAKAAVEQVLGFLKAKLPGPIGEQIDAVVSGKGPDLGGITGAAGGLLGKL